MNYQEQAFFDPRIADWLEGDPNEAPDQAIQVVVAALPSVKQRHASRLPWRFDQMTTSFKTALAAVAVVAVALGGLFVLNGSQSGGVGGPASSPSPTATAWPFPTDTSGGVPVLPGTYALELDARTTTGSLQRLRITMTVPSGWEKNITPTSLWQATDQRRFGFFTVDNLVTDPCPAAGNDGLLVPPLGPTVGDLATGLGGLPDLTATALSNATIDGYRGRQLDLMAPAEFPACVDGYRPLWTDARAAAANDGMLAIQGTETSRLVILDVDGVRLVIGLTYKSDVPAAAISELQSILDSIRIEPLEVAPSSSPS